MGDSYAGFNGAVTSSLRKVIKDVDKMTREQMLQWGRNFIVTESPQPNPARVGMILLQWGRNFIVTERPHADRHEQTVTDASMGP